MKSTYSSIPAEIEARLINANDWLRLPDTIQLGTYSVKDHDTRRHNFYVLYAVTTTFGLSFGAQYGFRLGEYLSHNSFHLEHPLAFCGASDPIHVAMVRYFLLQQEQNK